MRIISTFHDYYDTAMGYGQDPTLIYERKTVVHGLDHDYAHRGAAVERRWNRVAWSERSEYESETLLFCGQAYRLYRVTQKGCPTAICWSADDVAASLKEKEREAFEAAKRPKRPSRWYHPLVRWAVEDELRMAPHQSFIDETHRAHGPVVLLKREQIVSDPVLKDIEFQRVVDPYQAFQRIAQYLGGVLTRPDKEPRPIPDEDMRDMKGFDERSFKTHSPGKKARRRASQ